MWYKNPRHRLGVSEKKSSGRSPHFDSARFRRTKPAFHGWERFFFFFFLSCFGFAEIPFWGAFGVYRCFCDTFAEGHGRTGSWGAKGPQRAGKKTPGAKGPRADKTAAQRFYASRKTVFRFRRGVRTQSKLPFAATRERLESLLVTAEKTFFPREDGRGRRHGGLHRKGGK